MITRVAVLAAANTYTAVGGIDVAEKWVAGLSMSSVKRLGNLPTAMMPVISAIMSMATAAIAVVRSARLLRKWRPSQSP